MGYVILIGTLLLLAILLNSGLNPAVSKRIEYPELLSRISEGKVGRVAIRNNSLVGLNTTTMVGHGFPRDGIMTLRPPSARTFSRPRGR